MCPGFGDLAVGLSLGVPALRDWDLGLGLAAPLSPSQNNLLHDPVSDTSEKPELVEVDHHEGEQGDAGEGQVQLARCYLKVCKALQDLPGLGSATFRECARLGFQGSGK